MNAGAETVEQTLHKAVAQHQAGQLQAAGQLYLAILHAQPNHPEANHNLGALAVQMNQPVASLPYFIAALDVDPTRRRYWLSYIDALIQACQLDDARQILAHAQQQGLQGDEVEALGARLDASVPVTAAIPRSTIPRQQQINTLVSLFQQERYAEAETLALTMTTRSAGHPLGWMVLGAVFRLTGRSADALVPMQIAAALAPGDTHAHYNLGLTLQDLGHPHEAEFSYRRALEIDPHNTAAKNNLHTALYDQGRLGESEINFRRVLQGNPESAAAHCNLGNTLEKMGQREEAVASYRRALEIDPDHLAALGNLGATLFDLQHLDEAEAINRQALQLNPDNAELHSNLGNILKESRHLNEAETSYRRALQIKPDLAEAHCNLGITLMGLDRFVEAAACFRRTLEIVPDSAPAHQNLAAVLANLSDFEHVIQESDAALRLKPDAAMSWEQRLYSFSYHPDLTAQEIYAEFVRWGDRYPDPVMDFSAHDRTPGRRLRIGYVSPDFRRHTSRFFFWPLLANHDHAVVELFAYSNVKIEDDVTQQFKGLFDHWRNISRTGDAEMAALIRADKIDILVDGCNHMIDDRLGVFTLKPAPIQVTWLGAAWTTGLKMVDYALIDPHMAPEGTLTRETIVLLPHCFVAYQPPEVTAEIAPPPCLKNGFITFGYSGRTERLNHHTFRVWGEILRQNPAAKLILDFRPFADPATQAHYILFMINHGMNPSQVIMRNSANIFAGLNDIDVLLDSFPHSGGTMLFDALWMGIPVLTLASRPPVGRIGMSLMINLGLPEWVAVSQDDYTHKASTLAQDTGNLAQLRAGMRERMQNSPLMDGAGFARGVEAAYQDMFEKWADGYI